MFCKRIKKVRWTEKKPQLTGEMCLALSEDGLPYVSHERSLAALLSFLTFIPPTLQIHFILFSSIETVSSHFTFFFGWWTVFLYIGDTVREGSHESLMWAGHNFPLHHWPWCSFKHLILQIITCFRLPMKDEDLTGTEATWWASRKQRTACEQFVSALISLTVVESAQPICFSPLSELAVSLAAMSCPCLLCHFHPHPQMETSHYSFLTMYQRLDEKWTIARPRLVPVEARIDNYSAQNKLVLLQ